MQPFCALQKNTSSYLYKCKVFIQVDLACNHWVTLGLYQTSHFHLRIEEIHHHFLWKKMTHKYFCFHLAVKGH